MKKDFKAIPIEVEVWKEMRQAKLDDEMDIYKIVRAAWNHYKARDTNSARTHGETPKTTVPHAEWVRILAEILDSGDRDAIRAIQQNLLVFHRVMVPGGAPSKASPARKAPRLPSLSLAKGRD